MMNAKHNYKYFSTWIPLLFIASFLLYYSHKIPILICNMIYISIAIFGGIKYFCVPKIKIKHYLIGLFCLLTIVSGISSGIHTQNINFSLYLKTISYVIIAILALEYPPPHIVIKSFFYGVSAWFILILLNSKIDPNDYFLRLSRNYFSVLLLALLCLYYFATAKKACSKIPFTPALIYMVVSFLAVGRSGIFSSLILVSGILYINYWLYSPNSKQKFINAYFLGVAFIIFLFIVGQTNIVNIGFSRFKTMGIKSQGRSLIWKQYFGLTYGSLTNLLLGNPLEGIEIFEHYEYNLHNSFLQMHTTYGLPFSLIVAGGLAHSLYSCYKKKEYLIILLMATFLFRATTDQLGFAFFTEFLFYYFVFYSFFSEQKNKKPVLKEVNEK